MKTDMKTDAKRMFLVLSGGSLLALGCVIPPPQAPSAAPGSAASIHGTGAAAPAATARAMPAAPLPPPPPPG